MPGAQSNFEAGSMIAQCVVRFGKRIEAMFSLVVSKRTRLICTRTQFNLSDHGFSVLELIVVILLMGIVTAVVVGKFADLKAQREQMAAQELRQNLRYGRNVAMNRNKSTKIVFNVASNQYTVFVSDTNASGGYVLAKDPVTQQDWIEAISSKYSDAKLSDVSIGGGNTLIFSSTNGVPCDGSGQPISATGTVMFQSGPAVAITPTTGYVSVK